MEKPKKRKLEKSSIYLQYDKGFNHCYDEFKRYLPNLAEIKIILKRGWWNLSKEVIEKQAKAISKRTGK